MLWIILVMVVATFIGATDIAVRLKNIETFLQEHDLRLERIGRKHD